MQNSVMLFAFFVFDWKYPFWANLVQKVKIISLSWNLVPTLTGICKIQWWYLLSLFLIRNTLFGQIWSKSQNYQFKLKFGSYTNSKMLNSIAVFPFFVFDQKCTFWANLVQKVKAISLGWNLVSILIRICRF